MSSWINKIQEGQALINDPNNYMALDKPMVTQTQLKVSRLISDLHRGNYIDDMTKSGFHKLRIHHEYRNSIPLQKYTNLLW